MPALISTIAQFLTDNLLWVIIIAAAVLVVLAVIIIAATVSKRKKKNASAESEDDDVIYDATEITETASGESSAAKVEIAPTVASVADSDVSEKPLAEDNREQSDDAHARSEKPRAAKPAAKSSVAPSKRRASGKWVIEQKAAGEFLSKLCASNGEVMLTSEVYSTENGARSGIATIVKATAAGEFVIYRDKKDNYYYKLKSANNRLLCVGEIYKAKDQCERAVESVKRIAADAPISSGIVEGAQYVEYKPAPIDETELAKSARGKWRVEATDDGRYSAKLYANNGQLMLATEDVSTQKRATEAIETVRRNAAAGNFIIDRDKFGRYYYKLRNAQRSVICIGEAYEKLDSCVSAIESVRRFADNSDV